MRKEKMKKKKRENRKCKTKTDKIWTSRRTQVKNEDDVYWKKNNC